MKEMTRESAVRELVGSIIKEWREKRLNISQEAFAERYGICDRFVRMIESGKYLPSSMNFIRMVMDMDWKNVAKLMLGFRRIKRQAKWRVEATPALSFNECA